MAWTKYQLLLAGMMLITGSINTLSAKWADNFSAPGCKGSTEHSFSHPFLQAVGMFLGELSCLVLFHVLLCHDRRSPEPKMNMGQTFNPLYFFPPAMCDMTATCIMYVALNMTSASSFQMLRGAVIVFTGLLSVAFLGRKLMVSQWIGIFITITGLLVVGLADFSAYNSWLDSKSESVGPQRVAPSAGPPTHSTASVSPSAWNFSNPEDYSWLDSKSERVGPQRVAPSAGPPTHSTASISLNKPVGLELFYKWITDEVTEEAAKVFEILKIETLITGKTFGAEITFLDKLSQNLRSMGIDLQKQDCEYNSDKVLLLFCPIISRIGTDIDAVIQNISPYKKVILVVMHHSRKKVLSESSRLVNKSNVLETVDCLYYETDGFYHCDANTKAITSVSSALLRHQKTT
ncbi:UNVERIFIED_CONTAM: hypothetical protein FKN15_022223 [Acipenser sinensis]